MRYKILAIPNGLVAVLGFITLIAGIVVAAHSVGQCAEIAAVQTGRAREQDIANSDALSGGFMVILAGLIANIGGGLGTYGAIEETHIMVKASGFLDAACILFGLIGVFILRGGQTASNKVCVYSRCSGSNCTYTPDGGCDNVAFCLVNHDEYCAHDNKSWAAMLITVLAVLAACVNIGFGIVAETCPEEFDDHPDQEIFDALEEAKEIRASHRATVRETKRLTRMGSQSALPQMGPVSSMASMDDCVKVEPTPKPDPVGNPAETEEAEHASLRSSGIASGAKE